MYNHNKAQQSKNRVHISWDILYLTLLFIMHSHQKIIFIGLCNSLFVVSPKEIALFNYVLNQVSITFIRELTVLYNRISLFMCEQVMFTNNLSLSNDSKNGSSNYD